MGAKFILPFTLILLALSLGAYRGILPTAAAAPPPLPIPHVAVDPEGIANLTIKQNAVETFAINVTNAPAINGFTIVLTYDTTVLNGTGFPAVGNPPRVSRTDFTNNVLASTGNTIVTLADCVDSDGVCPPPQGGVAGVVRVSQTILGGLTSNSTAGLLFKISFVVKGGFSQIHIESALFSNGSTSNPVPVPTTSDGFFSNIDCPTGSGVLCRPPTVDFSWSPLAPHQGDQVIFNASASHGPTNTTTITRYSWLWGEGSTPIGTGAGGTELCLPGWCQTANPEPLNSTVVHVFSVVKNCSVTLTVTDTDRISWSKTQVVNVSHFLIDLSTQDLTGTPKDFVTPGAEINITATVKNAGTFPLNGSVSIILEVSQAKGLNKTLAQTPIMNLGPTSTTTLSVLWNTTGYDPKVYRVDAVIPSIINWPIRAGGNVTYYNETDTTNNVKSVWIQLVTPFSAGLSPSLLETTGIGILVIVGGGITVSRVRRRRPPPDFLEPTS
jgi:hypothetical protein